jgi:hypothetical protein
MTGSIAEAEHLQEANAAPVARCEPPRGRAIALTVLVCALVVFTVMALAVSSAKPPWTDEAWISVPSWNLAFHGKTGNPVMEPKGFWIGEDLPGIREIDYLNMPLYMLIQGPWFRLFGFTVFTMRAMSIFWGAAALIAWFCIVESFAGWSSAAVAAVLMACDFTYLSSAADGRMDMTCMALWAIGIAFYMRLRTRSLGSALVVANVFVAASMFTHPNGIIGFLVLAAVVAVRDRRRLAWSHLLRCWPYAAGALGWLGYIAIRPEWFLGQFGVNSGRQSGKLSLTPWDSFYGEIVLRNLAYFAGDTPWGKPTPAAGLLVVLLYWLVWVILVRAAIKTGDRSARYAAGLTAIVFSALTFLVGFKPPYYLIHIIPLYVAGVAVYLVQLTRRRAWAKIFAALIASVLLSAQAQTIRVRLENPEISDYRATVDFVRRHVPREARLVGSTAFYMDLTDYQLSDDLKLGYRTHIAPDFVIVDRWYKTFWDNAFMPAQPGAWLHIQNLIGHHAEVIFRQGQYTIYRIP